jgi:hypothetical protein
MAYCLLLFPGCAYTLGVYICDHCLLVIILNILFLLLPSYLHYFQSTLFWALISVLLGVILYLAGKLEG